ncbi:hypothetical protein [Clostridium polynesiense]|uniref:hypothetical protein n=1 Tax=Clostridium polynesiense TaxID=1325933 RepID=UPI00058E979E|nr:hypothetical protein [Clostridium polynesiense]
MNKHIIKVFGFLKVIFLYRSYDHDRIYKKYFKTSFWGRTIIVGTPFQNPRTADFTPNFSIWVERNSS